MDYFDIQIKIKCYLNKNKLRLCDKPFTINGEKGEGLQTLAENIATEIHQEVKNVIEVLDDLRKTSIINNNSILKFKEKDICSIKVHQPKHQNDAILEVEDIKSQTGALLKQKICQILNFSENFLKIIFKGKFINDDDSLVGIGIKNNSKVMIINLSENDFQTNEISSNIAQGRKMAKYLSKRAIDGKFKMDFMDLEITNQSGEVLQLTDEEKSNITYGLTMHKQATNYIRRGQYQTALLHCLEADEAFVRSKYCDEVDNVAILQLDIVWCYFCLQNVDDISESKTRLDVCEQRMRKCYGEGNERIQRIREKVTFEGVPEGVHIFRLYLMKGILAYYENDNFNATLHLNKALELFNSLSVPDDLIAQVMQLGFSKEEAVDGLRVNRNVSIAVEYLFRRNADLEVRKASEKESNQNSIIARRLGFTKNKSRINLTKLKQLIDQSCMMPCLCLAALKRCDNDYNSALDLVFSSEEELWKDINLARHHGEVFDGDISYEALEREKNAIKHIMELVSHDKDIIKRSLRQCDGNIDAALNILLDSNFVISTEFMSSSSSSSNSLSKNDEDPEMAELEKSIYHNIGEGSSTDIDTNYSNPDLFNELIAFNKFAELLNIPLITSSNVNIKWN